MKEMRVGDDRVKSSVVQRLLVDFEKITLCNGESVDNFAMRVIGLVDGQVPVSIEMHTDLNNMCVKELIGQLRVAEDTDAEETVDSIEKGV